MKKMRPISGTEQTVARVILRGVIFTTNSAGDLILELPAIDMSPFSGPIISEEARQWSMDNDIPESVYGDAYEVASKVFRDSIEKGLIVEYLKGRCEVLRD